MPIYFVNNDRQIDVATPQLLRDYFIRLRHTALTVNQEQHEVSLVNGTVYLVRHELSHI